MSAPAKAASPRSGYWIGKSRFLLRALAVACMSIQLLVDFYHWVSPASVGIPFWVMPLVMFTFLMGPGLAIWLLAEAIAVVAAGASKRPLLIDSMLVAIWLFVWSGHV